jgi:hypothetical protein
MQSLMRVPLVVTLLLCGISNVADACYCGAARYCLCRRVRRPATAAPCCAKQCHTVMKTCCEVVYEEVERTLYKPEYQEVVEKVPVDAVRYVEGTAYRCASRTVWQPGQPQPCGPAKTCAPAACGQPSSGCGMVPVQVLRKVPYTTARAEHYQKIEERRRVVVRQVPYTITLCVPKVVRKQVPVTVCCPMPCCCDKPSCCGQ